MKTIILFLSLLISANLFAQRDRGKTYALIVGISDYNDEKITDLEFAHRDANAFSEYLQSKAGGTVPSENIILLTNATATNGAIYDAFFKLSKKVKKKDRVFFYFSGHGDVENDTIYNLGFLLAWDTPYNCYRNNAVALEDINREAARLSVNRGAEVVYILDACRSGALAGDANNGRKLANDQMQKRFAKEVRIMSCESNQKSLEHPDIGGGRGIFSYFLIRGLIGKAERAGREDYQISLKEIRNYLEDKVAEEAKEYNRFQDPFVEGNRNFRLSKVNEEALQALIDEDSSRINSGLFAARSVVGAVVINPKTVNENKHAKHLVEAVKNSGLLLHTDFMNKIKSEEKDLYRYLLKQLKEETYQSKLTTAEKNAIQYFTDNAKDYVKNEAWQNNMNQLMAITLNDLAQQAINSYLQTDREAMESRNYMKAGEGMEIYPQLMARALEILPEDHPLYKSLKIKYHYFNGVVKRLTLFTFKDLEMVDIMLEEAFEQQNIAFKLDKQAAYIHNELGILNSLRGNKEKAEQYYNNACRLAPTWAIPYSNLGSIQNSKGLYDEAIKYADTSINLRPDYAMAWVQLGTAYHQKNNLLKAEKYFRKAINLNKTNYQSFERLAHTYLSFNDYQQAEKYFIESDKRKGIYKEKIKLLNPIYVSDQSMYASSTDDGSIMGGDIMMSVGSINDMPICVEIIDPELEKRIAKNSKDIEPLLAYARLYKEQSCPIRAMSYYEKVFNINENHMEANLMLAEYNYQFGNFEKSAIHYYKVHELSPGDYDIIMKLANIINYKLGRMGESIPLYYKALAIDDSDLDIHKTMAEYFYEHKQFEEAIIFFDKLEYYNPNDYRMLYKIADIHHQWNHYESAEKYYIRCLSNASQREEKVKVQKRLFNLYMHLERYVEAEFSLNQYGSQETIESFYADRVNQFQDNPYWLHQWTKLRFKSLRSLDSTAKNDLLKDFMKLIKMEPEHESLTSLYINMADIYSNIDSLQKANVYYEKAIKRDPSNADTYLKIVDSYMDIYEKEKAMNYLIHLDTSDQLDVYSRYRLANFLCLAGRYDYAQKALNRVANIFPHNSFKMLSSFGHNYMLSDKNEEAIKHYKQAYKKANKDKYHAYSLSRLYTKIGDYDKAIDWLDTAIQLGFDHNLILEYDLIINNLRLQRTEAFNALHASISP